MAVHNLVIFGILDDLENLLDGIVHICAGTTNENNIMSRGISGFGTDFD